MVGWLHLSSQPCLILSLVDIPVAGWRRAILRWQNSFLKQACNFCSLFEQLAWEHLPKPIPAGLPWRYMADEIFLTLGLSAAEWISLWKGMMSTVLLLDLLFLHKYTKLDCQQCVYCATDLYSGNNPKELSWKVSGRTSASCEPSWEWNAASDWVLFLSYLPLLDWEFEGGLHLFECAFPLLVLGCLTLFLLLVRGITVYFFFCRGATMCF